MIEALEGYPWLEVFNFSGEEGGSCACAPGEPERALPNDRDTPVTPFTRADVKRVIALDEGENDESDWLVCGELYDGRFFFLNAGCDYTGWGVTGLGQGGGRRHGGGGHPVRHVLVRAGAVGAVRPAAGDRTADARSRGGTPRRLRGLVGGRGQGEGDRMTDVTGCGQDERDGPGYPACGRCGCEYPEGGPADDGHCHGCRPPAFRGRTRGTRPLWWFDDGGGVRWCQPAEG